jgi:hypothetical protein
MYIESGHSGLCHQKIFLGLTFSVACLKLKNETGRQKSIDIFDFCDFIRSEKGGVGRSVLIGFWVVFDMDLGMFGSLKKRA